VRYASVCDGIGAAHVAWRSLGWECAWTSEIEPFPAAVVDHHFGLPNVGDMTKITQEVIDGFGAVDLLVGGTPCQSFSVAGLRGGLDDPRGNLALRFVQLASVMRPKWIVWENVPGVFSSGKGRDFGTFLGALEQLGYGWAYRTLDAQWFGVAQRRRRVFVVCCLGDWRRAAAVLFERESVFGNPPTRGAPGAEVARALSASTGGASAKEQQYTFVGGDGQPLNALGQNDKAVGAVVARAGQNGGASNADLDAGHLILSNDPAHAICHNEQRTYTNEGCVFQLRNCVAQPAPDPVAFQSNLGSHGGDVFEDGTSPTVRVGSGLGIPSPPAVAFKPSHYTRGKDGAPSDVVAPLSAEADKGDQDTVVAVDTYNQTTGDVSIPLRVGNAKDSLPAAIVPFTKSKRAQSNADDETWVPGDVSPTMSCFDQGDTRATTVVAYNIHTSVDNCVKGASEVDIHTALRARPPGQSENSTTTVVSQPQGFTYSGYSNQPAWMTGDRTDCLPASGHSDGSHQGIGVATPMAVRRLTPMECERLQGFPDGYTLIEYRGKPAVDSPRYRALGNSMAVPVMRWIGERINLVSATDQPVSLDTHLKQ
jgi:DNA (cytosine-5)-methyltransferase 1